MATVVHPYDAKTIDGTLFKTLELPRVVGFEGSGIIVQTQYLNFVLY